MDRKKCIHMTQSLSNDEILKQLDSLEKENPKKRVLQHCAIVRLSLKGLTQREISEIVDISPTSVNKILRRFHQHGVEGLVPIKQQGRPHFLSSEQEENIKRIILEKLPCDVLEGYVDYNWTGPLVIELIKHLYHVEYKKFSIYTFLHREDLSWTRPTYVLAKADPEK